MTTLVFGHKAPDTDSLGSALVWAWYLNHTGTEAAAQLLGTPNTEAIFVAERWGFEQPGIIDDVADDQACVIVDTNNPAELPPNINNVDITAIIDHHKLVGGLETKYAGEMFAAKSDVSRFSDAELLRMDSKEYAVDGTNFRVSVLETTAPSIVLERKASIMESMTTVAAEDKVDQVLLFVVDILSEEATLLIPNELTKSVAEKSFGVSVSGDQVVLPGVMSRKKQIIPALKV